MQSKAKTDTLVKSTKLLYYSPTYPNAILCYYASQIVLHINYDTSYLIVPEALSCYVRHFFLKDFPKEWPHRPIPRRNGPILMTDKTIAMLSLQHLKKNH